MGFRSGIASFPLVVAAALTPGIASAMDYIDEDKLNLSELPYGLTAWPNDKLMEIKSPLIDIPLGLVYISKSGYSESDSSLLGLTGELLVSPFKILGGLFGGGRSNDTNSSRGRVIANLWFAKQGNCNFVTVLQKRFYGDGSDESASAYLNIRGIDIGAGSDIVSLRAEGQPELFRRSQFTYTRCGKNQYKDCPEYTGDQYTLRRDWNLSSQDIRLLSQMPSKDFKIRYIFPSHTQLSEIKNGRAVSQIFSKCSA